MIASAVSLAQRGILALSPPIRGRQTRLVVPDGTPRCENPLRDRNLGAYPVLPAFVPVVQIVLSIMKKLWLPDWPSNGCHGQPGTHKGTRFLLA